MTKALVATRGLFDQCPADIAVAAPITSVFTALGTSLAGWKIPERPCDRQLLRVGALGVLRVQQCRTQQARDSGHRGEPWVRLHGGVPQQPGARAAPAEAGTRRPGHRHRDRARDRSRIQRSSMGGRGTSLPRPDAASVPLGDERGNTPLWRRDGGLTERVPFGMGHPGSAWPLPNLRRSATRGRPCPSGGQIRG